jgi:hypothetical protein
MDKIRTIKLQHYSDPGHSWLRISRQDADFLGILSRISSFSYQSHQGKYLYLEEDCDAPLAVEALKVRTDALPQYFNDRHTNKNSRVRGLQPYFHPHSTVIYSIAHDLNERLDNLERFIRINVRGSYEIPRPDFLGGYPWNAEMYYDVMDDAIQLIREHWHGWIYTDAKKSLIATNDRQRMIIDSAERAGTFIFKAIR